MFNVAHIPFSPEILPRFPVTEINSFSYQRSEPLLKSASPNGNEMLLDGKAPLPGQFMKLTNLANTFREVASHGKDGFYKGRVAQAIVDLIKSKGGVMELEDLAKHQTDFVDPIKYTFNGEVTVYEVSSTLLSNFATPRLMINNSVPRTAKVSQRSLPSVS